MKAVTLCPLLAVLALPSALFADEPKKAAPEDELTVEHSFKTRTPLGANALVLEPSGKKLFLLTSMECPELAGTMRVRTAGVRVLRAADGATPRYYPRHISFRVSASGRDPEMLQMSSVSLDLDEEDIDFLLRNLEFQLKAFEGLKSITLRPQSIVQLGVPEDVPSEERVFQVNFDLGKMEIEKRLVFEVLSPYGGRMSRFNVFLY